MKRREQSDWEELRDPESIPSDIEQTPEEGRLPDGAPADEDYVWRRPDRDYSGTEEAAGSSYREKASAEAPEQQVLSSEELYRKASRAKNRRLSEPQEPEFYDAARRRGSFLRLLVTLVLLALCAVLVIAVKSQLDLREDLIRRSEALADSETDLSAEVSAGGDTAESAEASESLPEVSVEIIGSWADRYTEVPEESSVPSAEEENTAEGEED